MTYADLIRHFHTEAAIQRALQLKHRQTVNKWKTIKKIPLEHQIAAEMATCGALKADIPPALRRSAVV